MSRNIIKHPEHTAFTYQGMVTSAPSMRAFCDTVKRVAQSDAAVLIRGASGTGKEHTARALHDLSQRAHAPLLAINCASLSTEMLASELFGHVRGAFTGAIRDRKGLFAAADGGTVFLDEIAEMPLEAQAQLLRALETKSFTPLGAVEPVTVDVRLIAATHKSLRACVAAGTFREDLMYRVRVVTLFLPRLIEREGDIATLAWHFIDRFNERGLRQITGIEVRVMEAMQSYDWPGNVRELLNVIEGAFALGEGPVLKLEELPPELRGEGIDTKTAATSIHLERERILEALKACHGRKGEAAEYLGMSRTTLWRKMREYQL